MSSEYLNNKFFEKIICQYQDTKRERSKLEIIIEDIKDTIDRKKNRKIKYENNKEDLKNKVNLYKSANQNHDDAKKHLAIAFFTLSENIVRYAKFQLIDIDDAVQEGVMICFEKINRFDPRKGKAFNYMTTCILNHFRQLYRSARNYNELKKKYLKHVQFFHNHSMIKNGKEIFIENPKN
jgi:DNA-directed RNA polymerase specialized sigma subunit